jgi:hypothetical protein
MVDSTGLNALANPHRQSLLRIGQPLIDQLQLKSFVMLYRKIHALTSLFAFAFLAGCTSPPSGLDLSLKRPTAHGLYVVEVQPLANTIAINKIHSWEAKVTLATGEPVTGARITVGGGMPQHGHGYPTQPRMTKELGDGRYLIEGMKFSMIGWWELKLDIASSAGADKVTFNTVIGQQ